MNEDLCDDLTAKKNKTVSEKLTYFINLAQTDERENEVLGEHNGTNTINYEHPTKTNKNKNEEQGVDFPKEVKINIGIEVEDSNEKLKDELKVKDSEYKLKQVAQRIIGLDRRIHKATWILFPTLVYKVDAKNQLNKSAARSPDDHVNQQDSPTESRTRPHYNGQAPMSPGIFGDGEQGAPMPLGPEYDPYERNSFIAAVFLIVFIMLVVTAACLILVFNIPVIKLHFQKMAFFYIIGSLILYFVLSYCFICGPCSRNHACGTILLILTTVCFTLECAAICVRYRAEIVGYAVVATAIVSGVCLALALSNFDFTSCILYVIVISVVIGSVGMVILFATLLFGVVMKPLIIVLLFVVAILEAVTLIIQLQMILGRRTLEYDEGEYYLAAFQLYTSIIQLFLTLVQILGVLDT